MLDINSQSLLLTCYGLPGAPSHSFAEGGGAEQLQGSARLAPAKYSLHYCGCDFGDWATHVGQKYCEPSAVGIGGWPTHLGRCARSNFSTLQLINTLTAVQNMM